MEPTPGRVAEISVVLATRHGRDGIARALESLCRQSRSDALELVIVAEASEAMPTLREAEAARFAAHRIVELPVIESKASANAAGARRANAPIVAFAEDHAFADPHWAESLLSSFEDAKVAAVGPRVRNANPASKVSWCDLVSNYGDWMSAEDSGPRETLPGFLSAYRRAALDPYEDRLEAWLEVENEMHREMHRQGATLCYEPGAVVDHVNLSRWQPWLAALFAAGRIYAAERAREWSVARRALYVLAWPAIPFVRLARRIAGWPSDVTALPGRWQLAPTLLLGLFADAAGQALGFANGAGEAGARMLRFEFGRGPHLRSAERHLVEASR